MRVLLVSPPWRLPTQGTVAIATLRPILEAGGHAVDELHCSMLLPPAGSDIHSFFQWQARYAFGRALTGSDLDDYVARAVRCMLADVDQYGVISPDTQGSTDGLGLHEDHLRNRFRESVLQADRCLDRIFDRAVAGGAYDVVGFSMTFDDQVAGAMVLARRLKEIWPAVKIACGGPACFEEQSEGLLATFPAVDAACHGEGEDVIVPLVEALGNGRSLSDVPGITWRDGGSLRKNPAPPLLEHMDSLPIPDYGAFIEQLGASEWRNEPAQLYFETSRGCWWGQKSLCSFCGLNAEGLGFRAKSPERAYQEIVELYRRYPTVDTLLATDNILDMKYLTTVFPRLAGLEQDPRRPLNLFYEVKSNMKLAQIEAMAAGGVRTVQPGIESFSDGVLDVMRKGCTALGQVQFVKWAHQSGTEPFYNVIILNPGEQASWYDDMCELVPFLEHLPHPQAVVTMLLERFSPYHTHPEAHGITNIRPKPFYRVVYGEDMDPRLAYQFDYDHAMFQDREHLEAVRRLVVALQRWTSADPPPTAYWRDHADQISIVDGRSGSETRAVLRGTSAQIFRYLDQYRTRELIARAFPAVPDAVLEALLENWLHRRWICRVGSRYLGVLPRRGPAAVAAREPVTLRLVG